MVHDKPLAENIKRIIRERGIKQYVVADRADIPARDLSAMLNGRKQILSVHVKLLSHALDTTPNELYGIEHTHSA